MNQGAEMGGRTGPYWRRQLGLEDRLDPRQVAMLLSQGINVSGHEGQQAPGRQILPRRSAAMARKNAQLDPGLIAQLQNHMQGAANQMQYSIPEHPEDLAQLLLGQHGSVNDAYHALMQKRQAQTNPILGPAVQRQQASRQVLQNALLSQMMNAQSQAHNMPAMQPGYAGHQVY